MFKRYPEDRSYDPNKTIAPSCNSQHQVNTLGGPKTCGPRGADRLAPGARVSLGHCPHLIIETWVVY